MIELICEKVNIEIDKVLKSFKYYGNILLVIIFLLIDLVIKEGKIKKDDLILLVGFGGGLVYVFIFIRWII